MVVGFFTRIRRWTSILRSLSGKSASRSGRAGKIMCAASAALKFLQHAGEVEGKYLQDIGLLGGETQRGQQHANTVEMRDEGM
jgi:hypothetical protein